MCNDNKPLDPSDTNEGLTFRAVPTRSRSQREAMDRVQAFLVRKILEYQEQRDRECQSEAEGSTDAVHEPDEDR